MLPVEALPALEHAAAFNKKRTLIYSPKRYNRILHNHCTAVKDALEGRLAVASAGGCRHVHAQIAPGQRDSCSIAVTVGLGHRQESNLPEEHCM